MDAAARCIWPVLVLLGAGTAGADHFHGHHPWHGPCEPVPECRVPPLHQRPILRARPVHPDCGPGPLEIRSLRSSWPEILGLLAGIAHGEMAPPGADHRDAWRPAPPDLEREQARRDRAAAAAQAERERQAAAQAQAEQEQRERAAAAARARQEALEEAERRRADEQKRAAMEDERRRDQAGAPDPADPPKPAPKSDYPAGIPIPGREGMVTVPSAGHDQPIDVRGIPSGTLVKDPISGTKFRVP